MNWNTITARFFTRSTWVEIIDPANDGQRVRIERAGSIYPGGASVCSLVIDRDPTAPLPFNGGDNVRLYNGPRVVWEGVITSTGHYVGDADMGVRVNAIGHWGWHMSATIDKRWADDRLDEWRVPTTAWDANDQSLTEIVQVDQNNRLRFTPKNVAFTTNWYARRRYSMPTGQTVKRVKMTSILQEAGQAWGIGLLNETSTAVVYSILASGSNNRDDTLATPSQNVFIFFQSQANQTPPTDGTIYGQFDSSGNTLMVYSETGNINCLEVFKDIRAMVSDLSSDETLLDTSLTVSVEPFITDGHEPYSSILSRIAGYGTSSYGAIGYGIKDSTQSSDGKPILFAEPWPALTDYEYEVSLKAQNLSGGLNVVRDFGTVANWIVVTYQDLQGVTRYVTPDDDANLKDDDSIARFGKRQLARPLSLGQLNQTLAVQYGRRYLAVSKDPQVYVSGTIQLRGYITGKNGAQIPTSYVQAGQRVKVVDFVSDVIDVSGAGLTAVITFAEYADTDGGTVSLSFGVPDNLAIMLARMRLIQNVTLKAGENTGKTR